MRGRFTPGAAAEEWCERRLLARIHGYTVKRLRAEIEPVAARDFLRFLLGWQRVAADARMEGPQAVDTVVGQLEGFEAPAGAWESEILPARLAGYEPTWLDDRCLAGHVAWTRLRPRAGRTSNGRVNGSEGRTTTPVRTTPITLIARRHAALWASLSTQEDGVHPSHQAQLVLDHIRAHGASFFEELVDGTGLLRSQIEEALGELVTLGLVSSDSFGGLRALLVPSGERRPIAGAHRRRRTAKFGMEEAGRWALVRRPRPAKAGAGTEAGNAQQAIAQQALEQQAVEHVARTLLLRYGVVFWRLLEREAAWLPPWRDLLRVYRRLESRGDIRGGRFVAGFSGEQFALPDAVATLREVRRQPACGALVSLSGADPLNLAGILTPGPRLAALTGNRLLYRDGVPIALLAAGEVQFLETLDAASEWVAHKALLRSAVPGPPIASAAPARVTSVPNASRV
jgi:ATP-dependent Lhr-like helicase